MWRVLLALLSFSCAIATTAERVPRVSRPIIASDIKVLGSSFCPATHGLSVLHTRVIAHVVSASKPVSSVESAAVATLRILQSNLVLSQSLWRESTRLRQRRTPSTRRNKSQTAQKMGAAQAVRCRDRCASPSRPATPSCSP